MNGVVISEGGLSTDGSVAGIVVISREAQEEEVKPPTSV